MLLVGRGGEGVVLASQILADTFARAGFHVQSFPEFKAERRGAPISAFLRWDDGPIHRRYKVRECDVLLDVSPNEPPPQALASVRPGGLVLLNRESRYPHTAAFDIARVPASRIARELGVVSSEGRPMGNTAVLGAAVRYLLPDGFRFLEQALRARMGARAKANVAAARAGFARAARQHRRAGDSPVEPPPPAPPRLPGRFPVSTTDSLGNHTGSWSLDRPLVSAACTACGVCVVFCPEGAISRDGDRIVVDYLYCKGCGICEVVCPVRNALHMEEIAG
jgi:2-oxoacid:acceptor oxidoreductase gamma subunit (pyruvate/2-ketoisovalerate family)/2-oxoacid:acceptor oxidoreductase delta subunit (pyruvate/2-ketoisovalerate family)